VDKPLRGYPSSPGKSGRSQNRSSKNAVKNVSKSASPVAKVAVKKNAANAKQKTKSRR
jgi:hypothetical protein